MKTLRYVCFYLAVTVFILSLPLTITATLGYSDVVIKEALSEEEPDKENDLGTIIVFLAYLVIGAGMTVSMLLCTAFVLLFLFSAWDRGLELFFPSMLCMGFSLFILLVFPIVSLIASLL